MEIGGQCRLRPSAGLDKEVLSFQKEVLRVSLFSNYSKKLLKTGPPVLIICTFSMEPGARCGVGGWSTGLSRVGSSWQVRLDVQTGPPMPILCGGCQGSLPTHFPNLTEDIDMAR